MKRQKKPRGPKRISYALVDKDTVHGAGMYKRLRELRAAHHTDLEEARIALAWCTSWKPDRDGRVTLGKCMKATDLARELAPWDYIVLLSQGFWQDVLVSDEQRTALLDHELCHAAPTIDDRTGLPLRDEKGRIVWRIRKHDLEEFNCIGERYGTWKGDVEEFYAAIRRNALRGFVPCDACKDSGLPGYRAVDEKGTVVQRCECWLQWQARLAATPAPATVAS